MALQPVDFNSYGSRRGNHEVMMRGTFANVRMRNKLTPELEGAYTRHLPDGEEMSIYDASVKYRAAGTPLMVLAGKEYGSGSSRDWAAKGPRLLGVRVAIAESFERIHRSNLVGMGILPLQFLEDENAETHGLTGEEVYDIVGLTDVLKNFAPGKTVKVRAKKADGSVKSSTRRCASILRRRCCITSTAGFCSMCCGSCGRTISHRSERTRGRMFILPFTFVSGSLVRPCEKPEASRTSRFLCRISRVVAVAGLHGHVFLGGGDKKSVITGFGVGQVRRESETVLVAKLFADAGVNLLDRVVLRHLEEASPGLLR